VKINAIEVPEGAGAELERRFAARAVVVDQQLGFKNWRNGQPFAEKRYRGCLAPVVTGRVIETGVVSTGDRS